MKQSRKEFIKQAHEAASWGWKKNIEDEFPKLFKKDDLVVGDWYITKEVNDFKWRSDVFPIDRIIGKQVWSYNNLSFEDGKDGYFDTQSSFLELHRKATDKEVGDALIKEAKKIGFKEGIQFIDVVDGKLEVVDGNVYQYSPNIDTLTLNSDRIYKNGKWAEIITEPIVKEEKANGWYKDNTEKSWCMFFEKGIMKHGVNCTGEWVEDLNTTYTLNDEDYKATDKEVGDTLIKEAKRIGYKEGVKFIDVVDGELEVVDGNVYRYCPNIDELTLNFDRIYKNGKWAKIITESITKEQAEKELGKTIIN
jgi:alpha-acetolactate decarboxylase